MNPYQEKYIELKKDYEKKNKIDSFFEFRTELENASSKEAKQVLVHVYTLLHQYKKAYNLMQTLISPSDKKGRKNMAVMQKMALEYGDYLEKRPLNQVYKDNKLKMIPTFRYHPNPFLTGTFEELEQSERCECCGKNTKIIYQGPFYSQKEITYLCPDCIADGSAAKEFEGEFQDEYSTDNIEDPAGEKLEELIHRTPGYSGLQQEYWRAHCNDYCAFIGYVGSQELKEMGIMEEVLADTIWTEEQKKWIRNELINGGRMQAYLFQCLHCSRHLLWIDYD